MKPRTNPVLDTGGDRAPALYRECSQVRIAVNEVAGITFLFLCPAPRSCLHSADGDREWRAAERKGLRSWKVFNSMHSPSSWCRSAPDASPLVCWRASSAPAAWEHPGPRRKRRRKTRTKTRRRNRTGASPLAIPRFYAPRERSAVIPREVLGLGAPLRIAPSVASPPALLTGRTSYVAPRALKVRTASASPHIRIVARPALLDVARPVSLSVAAVRLARIVAHPA